jgi:uncharacterized protein YecE (DUF72 family)
MSAPVIGTVDLPDRMERERYFRELSYLELSALFGGPLKPSALERWKVAPPKSLGIVAPWVLTQRTPPPAPRSWPHDDTVGDFRDSAPGRAALAQLRDAVVQLSAACVVFRSPPLFAASSANRDRMRQFFAEVATPDAVGDVPRVWIPDGIWDVRTAITFATELGLVCAFDPLVRDPGQPPEVHEDLEVEQLYFRISGLGRTGPLRTEKQEDLVALVEHYEGLSVTIAFDSPLRWQDARNFKQMLEGAP